MSTALMVEYGKTDPDFTVMEADIGHQSEITDEDRNMKALKFPEPKKFEYVEIEVPAIADDQILLKVMAAGICHSDIVAYNGKHPFRIPPVVTGHEFSGTVVEVGKKAGDAFRNGDRVCVEPHAGCGTCFFCREGKYNLCVDKKLIGVGDWIGCFSEYVAVYPSMCFPIPPGGSYAEGALVEPYAVGNHAVELADLPPGSSAAVLGCGTIGMMGLVSLVNHSCGTVIGSDISEFKRSFAAGRGATHVFNPVKDDIVAEVMRITGGLGVDAVFVNVGVPAVLEQAVRICRKAGKIIIVALFDDPVVFDIRSVQQGQRAVLGTNMYTRTDYTRAVEGLGNGTLSLEPLVTRRIPFSEAGTVVDEMSYGKHSDEIKVIIDFTL